VDEAKDRRELLRSRGPSAQAFTLRQPFPAPDQQSAATADDDWFCPA
jgi:hypothetical protein